MRTRRRARMRGGKLAQIAAQVFQFVALAKQQTVLIPLPQRLRHIGRRIFRVQHLPNGFPICIGQRGGISIFFAQRIPLALRFHKQVAVNFHLRFAVRPALDQRIPLPLQPMPREKHGVFLRFPLRQRALPIQRGNDVELSLGEQLYGGFFIEFPKFNIVNCSEIFAGTAAQFCATLGVGVADELVDCGLLALFLF